MWHKDADLRAAALLQHHFRKYIFKRYACERVCVLGFFFVCIIRECVSASGNALCQGGEKRIFIASRKSASCFRTEYYIVE